MVFKKNTMNEEIAKTKLSEIALHWNISSRAYNICEDNDLLDLEKLLHYFWQNGNFLKLRNCGSRSNLELINICNNFNYLIPESLQKLFCLQQNSIISIISSLTDEQKKILNILIEIKFQNLSLNSSVALKNTFGHAVTNTNMVTSFFTNPNFNAGQIKGVLEKSENEINLFVKEVKNLVEHIFILDKKRDLNLEIFKAMLINLFSLDTRIINSIKKDYDFSKGIPIFKTISILIKRGYIFNEQEKMVFNYTFGFNSEIDVKPLSKIGNSLGITLEQTKRIRIKIINNFNKYFSFLNKFEIEYLNLYELDTSTLLLNIDRDFVDILSKTENVRFNGFFINRIFAIIFTNKYTIIGYNEKTKLWKLRHSFHKWKTTYLISIEICFLYDFVKFVNDVSIRRAKSIKKDYEFKFQTYFLSFRKTVYINDLDGILQVAKQLLFSELGIIIEAEGNIVFKRNGRKLIIDYVYDILKEWDKPLTIDELFKIINQRYPNLIKNANSLKGICPRDSRLMYSGNRHTYGLKSWEEKT